MAEASTLGSMGTRGMGATYWPAISLILVLTMSGNSIKRDILLYFLFYICLGALSCIC